MADIKLEDILAGQHLSPFTLEEFEHYLANVSHSVENLYFYFCLSDYTDKYGKWEANVTPTKNLPARVTTDPETPRYSEKDRVQIEDTFGGTTKDLVHRVSKLFSRLLNTEREDLTVSEYKEHGGKLSSLPQVNLKSNIPEDLYHHFEILQFSFLPLSYSSSRFQGFDLELNISQESKDHFKFHAETSIHPEIFSPIKKEVVNMLTDSMHAWLLYCSGNSYVDRAQFTTIVGGVCVFLTTIGTVLLVMTTTSREIILCLSSLFWIGVDILFCGLYRACPLIFVFGSYRKFHVWQLLKAKKTAAIVKEKLLSRHHQFPRIKNQPDQVSLNLSNDQKICVPFGSDPSTLLKAWDSRLGTQNDGVIICGLDNRNPPHIEITMSGSSLEDTETIDITSFKLSHLEKMNPTFDGHPKQPVNPSSSRIFASVKNIGPATIRSLQIRMVKSALLATIWTILWIAVLIFAPDQ